MINLLMTYIYVEGVTLVLPSCFSCLTNIRENISYKLEYQLCETRSIRMSTSITLKQKRTSFLPLLSSKSHLTHTRKMLKSTQLYISAQACEHSILTLATFTGVRETSLALKVPKSFGFKGTRGHNPKSPKAKVSLCEAFRPMLPLNTLL
jgi:hypothetical protein